MEKALEEAEAALKGEDLDEIKKTQEALKQASYKLSEAMYADQGQPAEPGTADEDKDSDSKDDDDVVDAEFEVN